jgi:hypothetical protein
MTTDSAAPSSPAPTDSFQPVAMLLAWVCPGAGHFFLGHTKRGAGVCAGVLGLFVFGLFLAGPTAVDSGLFFHNLVKRWTGGPNTTFDTAPEGDPIWFAGTAFVGPIALAVDYYHQFNLKQPAERNTSGGVARRSPRPFPSAGPDGSTISPAYSRALGRVAEIGVLSCTLAGMLNLIAIIDAAHHHRAPRRRREGGSA